MDKNLSNSKFKHISQSLQNKETKLSENSILSHKTNQLHVPGVNILCPQITQNLKTVTVTL